MNAYAITLFGNETSTQSVDKLFESHVALEQHFDLIRFPAITPDQNQEIMAEERLVWTYPWENNRLDGITGLKLHPYATRDRGARIACFLSHYHLWKLACETGEWVMILEDDTVFTKHLDLDSLPYREWSAVGINNPLGATRRAPVFHDKVVAQRPTPIIETPWVDDEVRTPQGLAGHSAYMISPELAKDLIHRARHAGCWPNDALMCKQLYPGKLGVTTEFYTRVQQTPSTLA